MARIVMKFGGTSVAELDRIRNVAKRVQGEVDRGNQVAVVVSAMAGVTNQLVDYVDQASSNADLREYDTVVSSGEQVTSGLLSIVLEEMGVPARSWQGWQIPMRTNGVHGSARIERIETESLERLFAEGKVAVVAGFQGISEEARIATQHRVGWDGKADNGQSLGSGVYYYRLKTEGVSSTRRMVLAK